MITTELKKISLLSNFDLHLFNEGSHFHLYNKLGSHYIHAKKQKGTYFAVWAPNAKSVAIIGNFNHWRKNQHYMHSCKDSGIWELYIPNIEPGEIYKYLIHTHNNDNLLEKADPFAFYAEIPPKTASIVCDLDYQWHDELWMSERAQKQKLKSPISIYEVHLGSWMRVPECENRWLSYRELAPLLAAYVNTMGYTHVEILPIMEHPYYLSWGYQTTGYFAPTARYGKPQDFMYLIDFLHQNNIGVILDWVPSHFPMDDHGLHKFDGTYLYEHADPKKGYHPDWKSSIFNYGRHEVQSFLISSAFFWLDKYHIDCLRVDAVASMLYLDYSRQEGEWIPNIYGGRENLEAVNFIKRLNEEVYKFYSDVQTMAEESTAWSGVSHPTFLGGLGFGFKWDMGWMHDSLLYFSHDPVYRKYHHNKITFRGIYAFSENFILPLSHDEVVHGKSSIVYKMPGNERDKFANLRLLLGYMFGQPGKKLLFMGIDLGQTQEWNVNSSIDWHLLQYSVHEGIQKWVKKLNFMYRSEPALYEADCKSTGYEWVEANDYEHSVLTFIRKSNNKKQMILIVINATPIIRENYKVGVPKFGEWTLIANSDESTFDGSNFEIPKIINSTRIPYHDKDFSIILKIPPLTALFYKWAI